MALVVAFIQIMKEIMGFFFFMTVVDEFERAIILQFGKFRREVGPGFWFHLPFCIDRVITENVCFRTQDINTQTLTTRDGDNVTVKVVVAYRVSDIKKFLLEIDSAKEAIEDSLYGSIGELVRHSTFDEMKGGEWHVDLQKKIRHTCQRFGIRIYKVRFSDFARMPAFRLIQTQDESGYE